MGEGFGGLLSAQTTLLMGAPGAALLYAVISLGIMPRGRRADRTPRRPAQWLGLVWVIVWLGGAVLQLVQGQNTAADLSVMIHGMASGAPGWLASLDLHAAAWLLHAGDWFIILLVFVQALIGALALCGQGWRRLAIGAGVLLSVAFWIVGQSLGGYYTGLATDPSTAPLMILLGIAVLGTETTSLAIL